MKATTVVLKFDTLLSKRHHEINPIHIRLIRQIYLSWDQNSLDEEFVKHEDEEVQYEEE